MPSKQPTALLRDTYRCVDKSLARPTSRCFLFDGENISFDASHVIYTTRYTAQQRITKYVSCFGFAVLTFAFTEIGYPLEFPMTYSEFQLLKLYYDTPDSFPCQYRLPPYPLISQ